MRLAQCRSAFEELLTLRSLRPEGSRPQRMMKVGLMLALLIVTQDASQATVRIQRRFDQSNGLTVPTIFGLAQDSDGFIWLGTAAGLLRYDGPQMRPWAKDIFRDDVSILLVGANGEVLAAANLGTLYRMTATGAEPLPGPGGNPIYPVKDVSSDAAQRLWVVSGEGALHFRDPNHQWHAIDTSALFPGERVRRTRPASGGHIYVLTDKGVWRMSPGELPQRVLETLRPIDVADHPSGSTFVLAWWKKGEIIELQKDGRVSVRASHPDRRRVNTRGLRRNS
jgi:ligand-binding sensor domain-containing protein